MSGNSDYLILKKKFNEILDNNLSYTYQAISKLHIIKEHSEYFSNFKSKKNFFLNKIKNYLIWIVCEKKSLYHNYAGKSSCDYLVISNIIKFQNNSFKDDYFGNIDTISENSGLKTIKAIRNLSDKSTNKIFKKMNSKNYILLSKRSTIFNEAKYIFELIKSFFLLKIFSSNSFLKKNLSIKDFMTIPGNLRIGDQILEILKFLTPKAIIFTFEGHAWERILINKIKTKYPKILLIGYQFTTLIENQNSIYRKTNNNFSPNIIFATGKESKSILEKKIKNVDIKILGSTKNFKVLKKNFVKKTSSFKNILFVPEGLLEENYKMFIFFLKSAMYNVNLNFKFRCHPLIDQKKFFKDFQLEQKVKNLDNVEISSNEFERDILDCDYIVFRGSSVAFNACINNRIPIYLDIDEFNCNPLYKILPKNLMIREIKDFRRINNQSEIISVDEIIKLKKYCSNYFEELNLNTLKETIK